LHGCGGETAPKPSLADAASGDAAQADAGQDAAGATQLLGFCPPQGRALVRPLLANEGLAGPAALGTAEDWVISNRYAAFVIQKPGRYHTYYYYGGLPIDAAPLQADAQGCRQAGPDTFGEMAFATGIFDAADFPQSVLRGFRGDKAEVVHDGADGQPAVLRVWGSDQTFWLVEMELIRRAYSAGGSKPRSQPLGIRMAVDYVLAPESPVLEMKLRLFNDTDKPRELAAGAVVFADDSTELEVWSGGKLDIGGFGLQTGVPFISARGVTSWGLATAAQNLARANISGVDALVDLDQIGGPLTLAPKGKPGDEVVQTWWLSVAQGGSDRAIAALQPRLPEAQRAAVAKVTGTVVEAATGKALSGGEVVVERLAGMAWAPVVATSVVAGKFELQVPAAVGGQAQRLRLRQEGWPEPEPRPWPVQGAVDFALQPPARLVYEVRDTQGKAMPAKMLLYQAGALVRRVYTATGTGELLVPPGNYEVSVARGYEYGVFEQAFTASAATSSQLKVVLPHHVDTTGFLCLDGHVHAGPSADSTVPMARRFVTAAAEGLEVVMHTDHEIITDPAPDLAASGVAAWVASVPGEELTAAAPEHINLWGTPPDPSDPRGRPVSWFDKDFKQLYQEGRARGAQIVTLNHPRGVDACNYLCAVEWDRIAGAPKLTDPTAIGMPQSATLWSWDFDAMELMNGTGNPFAAGVDGRRNGVWDDWQSFLNFGHRITGLGVSDAHDEQGIGTPRTYIAAPTDDPAQFTMAMAQSAVLGGRALVSAGGFARVQIGDKGLGDTVAAVGGQVELMVEVQAIPQIDVQRVVVWANCDEVASVTATAPDGVVKFKGKIPLKLSQDAHITLGAFGSKAMPRGFEPIDPLRVPRVITNPIYVDVDGDGKWTPPGGKACTYKVGP
jgi:hypothetical protein